MFRDSPPSREAREGIAPTLSARAKGGGGLGTDFDLDGGLIAPAVTAKWAKGSGGPSGNECQNLVCQDIANALRAQEQSAHDHTRETYIAHALRGEGFDASEDGTGRGTPLVAVDFTNGILSSKVAGTLEAAQDKGNRGLGVLAFDCKASGQNGFGVGEVSPTLRSMGHKGSHQNAGGQVAVYSKSAVRRLTPRECERLQGFPDDYTRLTDWDGWRAVDEGEDIEDLRARGLTVRISKKTGKARVNDPDGPRYKALGNSMAVPAMHWIGNRIRSVKRLFPAA